METPDSQSAIALQQPATLPGWILRHDDSKLFAFLYIGLALVLSIAIGLFWLVLVVAVHFALDLYKYSRLLGSWKAAAARAAWELKLDLSLVLFALWLSVYMDLIFGIAGLGAGARAAAQASSRAAQAGSQATATGARAAVRVGARFAAWQRVIRGILLSLDDVGLAVRAAVGKKGKKAEKRSSGSGWGEKWSTGDKLALGLGLASLLLILAAPLITPHTLTGMFSLLAHELKPFP